MQTAESVGPVIEAPVPRDVRRAADALRMCVAAAVLLATVLLAVATRDFARAAQQGLVSAVTALPAGLRDLLVGIVQVAAVVGPLTAMVVLTLRRRVDAVLRVVPAAALGVVFAWSLTHLALEGSRPDQWPGVLTGRGGLVDAGWPSAVYLAGCAAAVVAAGPWLGRRWRRVLWWLIAWSAGLSVVAAAIVPLDALTALAVGGVAGSAVLLLGGAPTDRPAPQAVAAALEACGMPVDLLRERPDQRAGEGLVYTAETPDGHFTVRVLGLDDRDRDLFRRLSRRLMLRDPADVAQSPLAAVEHELLMLVAATRAGARTVEPVIAYPVTRRGALLVTADGETRPLPESGMTEDVLTDLWRSVAKLQAHRVAHRALRPEHVLVEADGRTRLTAFARGQLAASPVQLGADIAELLATTAVQTGTKRATAAARAGLGPDLLTTALPYLQPLAMVGPARHAVADHDQATARAARAAGTRRTLRPGGRPSLLHELAVEVQKATGVEPVPPAKLSRFTWKKALALAGGFLVLHLVLPQLANMGAAAAALRTANWWWVLAALPTTFLSQLFSAFLQAGTIPERLPFGPNYVVQFASSFLNRITPNNVGGMALNLRFLQKAGVDSGAATASIGLQTLANGVSSIVVAAVFFAWTGQRHSGVHIGAPAGRWVLPAVVLVLTAGGLLGLTGPGRRFLHDKLWRFVRSAADTIAAVAADPAKLTLGIVGAIGLSIVQVGGSPCASTPSAATCPSPRSEPSTSPPASSRTRRPHPAGWAPSKRRSSPG